ncbi:hypothetical protein I6H56_07435 [Fusobacterium canifelinum]|uniref:DUF3137 domain-containing protein n=1 Tax=Fusobacterium canifelinum TaxID=285729 RepID=A0A7T4KFS1_9FUSO|nr:hypothetical protein [Fusobacterium canifelinum]QQB73151.1 hypothetical protein I6H56_07435 [Fusobacterium canifelinum]
MTLTYNFRYSRFIPGGILNILFLGLLWIISIFISMLVLYHIGIGSIFGSKGAIFWDNNSKLVLILIFLLPVIFIIIFTIIGSILYRHLIDSKGVLNIFNNYAKLYYKGKEITLEKGNFSISYDRINFGRRGAGNFLHPVAHVYEIKIKNIKYRICESIQEGYELTTFWQRIKGVCPELSLSTAMNALIKLANTKNNEIKNEIFYIGSVQIIINVSTLDVFEDTNYFVDMENALAIKDVPFILCDIYESKDSNHLIGEVGLIDDEKNDKLPSIEELKKRVIVSGIELDEHINNI